MLAPNESVINLALRRSDKDIYRHVNATYYVNFAYDAFLQTLFRAEIATEEQLRSKDRLFFLSHAQIHYIKGIEKTDSVLVKTSVSTAQPHCFSSTFSVVNEAMSVTFTQGELVINDVSLLKKNKNHSRNAHFNPYSALCDGVSRKARVFERLCDVRFTDLDPLGIVRPSFYLDAVVSSRWTYLEKDLGVSVLELAERGFGVYLVSSNVECFSPIARTLPIRVRSYVAVTEKKLMKVRFEIRSDDLSVIFANGEFDSLMIDLKTRKTQILPSWVEPYIYERGDFSN